MQLEAFELAYNLVAFGNHEGREVADRVREEREASEAAAEPVDEAEQTVLSQAPDAEGTARELILVAPDDIQPILTAPIED